MRILIATTYIYDDRWSEFTRNKTGFGIMVNTIFQAISEKEEVYLISHVLTKGHEKKLLKHTLMDVLFYGKWRDWRQGIKWFITYKQPIKERVKYLYYCVNKGYVRRKLQCLHPDIVHIHGIGYATKTYMEVCEELKVPYIVTLHGLIGLNDSVQAARWDKQLEREFLIRAEREQIPVTVISTGIKKRGERYYLNHESANIDVITNGTKVLSKGSNNVKWNLRDKFHLEINTKIGLVIGSICENKNQKQVIDAFASLPQSVKDTTALFICGKDTLNGQLQKYIRELQLDRRVFILGFVKQDVLSQLLKQADLNIVASFTEGFGLPIIEGFIHGVPSVTFADLDAIPDLWNEKAMLLAESRSTEDLSKAIQNALIKEWDREFIKKYAINFSLDQMAKQYQKKYSQILK